MHVHFGLQDGVALVDLGQDAVGGEKAEDLPEPGQKAILHVRVFQELQDQAVVDILVGAVTLGV